MDVQDSDFSFKVVSNILQVAGFANVESKELEASNIVENVGICGDTQEGKLYTLTNLLEETKDFVTKESTGLGIAKQDQEACNDIVEGRYPSQSFSNDNASEADLVEKVTDSSIQIVGKVEIGNFSAKLDGRQKEAYQVQVCISHQKIQDSDVHPEICSNTSCFTEVLVHSNVGNSVIAIHKRGTSYDDRKTIDKSNDGKLDVFNENSSSRSNFVPLLYAKEETNLQIQISEEQVPPTADSLDHLKSSMMATMESFEIGNVGRKLGVKQDSGYCVMISPASIMVIGLQEEKGGRWYGSCED